MTDCALTPSNLTILPRQGEVAPKVTEGEDAEQRLPLPPPPTGKSQPPPPCGGEDRSSALAQRSGHQLVQTRVESVVRSEELVTLHRAIAAAEVGDETAGFLHQQHASRNIPRLQV